MKGFSVLSAKQAILAILNLSAPNVQVLESI